MWRTAELWGLTHLVLPGTFRTVCLATLNVNSEFSSTNVLNEDVNCVECLHFAQVMHIPTAIAE